VASAIALSLLAASASGQNPSTPERDTFWLGLGGGVGSEDIAASMNGSYQFGANLVSLRATATAGLFDDGFNDYAVLYGRATRPGGKRFHFSGSLGVGLVNGCRSDGFLGGCRDIPTVVGLPLELQAFWRPGSLVGLGLLGFANFNGARSFAGLTLGLQFGRLR
jgi:hypothetical protein